MPDQYTVTEVSPNVGEWKAQGRHPMKEYRVHLEPVGGGDPFLDVEWSRRDTSPAPEVGQVILVDRIEDRAQHGYKLHLAQQASGYQGGGEDPARAARIMRQHSQEMAIRTIRLMADLELERPMNTNDLWKQIKGLADWFDRDARGAAGE